MDSVLIDYFGLKIRATGTYTPYIPATETSPEEGEEIVGCYFELITGKGEVIDIGELLTDEKTAELEKLAIEQING